MKFLFVTNYINHHQVPVSDVWNSLPGVDFRFIATTTVSEERKRGGYKEYTDKPYLFNAYASAEAMVRARRMIDEADVVLAGAVEDELLARRLKECKVTFHYSERWFKRDYHSLLSPRAWLYWYRHHIRYRDKPSYMMCSSAFTAPDVRKTFSYPGKCFKWGYFTATPEFDFEKKIARFGLSGKVRMMFVGRFLSWKHPEMPVKLAVELRKHGYEFEINMYGGGEKYEEISRLIEKLGVGDCVFLKGNLPNEELMEEMRRHEVFLFTSDRNEGWGAVLNEAMSNACAVVAADEIGSVPYLIRHGHEGMVFRAGDGRDFYRRVSWLLDHPEERRRFARAAYRRMHEEWSPEVAARRFVQLAQTALHGCIKPMEEGPCSKA